MPSAHEKRVAVIAVHGVADQKPGDSQAAIAALLLSSTAANGQPLYEPFASRTISVPLEPAYAKAAAADITRAAYEAGEFEQRPSLMRSLTGWFDESPVGYRTLLAEQQSVEPPPSQVTTEEQAAASRLDAGLAYMRMLLARYKPKIGARAYNTDRREGRRKDGDGASARTVDVYEMYWADLSTLGKDPFRFFSSLYQLVLHLSELGRRALEDGLTEFSNFRRWRWLLWCQAVSVRQLAVPIPIINLLLLVTLLGAVLVRVLGGSIGEEGPASVDLANAQGVRVAVVLAAVVIAIGAMYAFAAPPSRPRVRDWWPLPALAALAGAALGVAGIRVIGRADVVLITEWWLIAFALTEMILRKYDKVRPGARKFGRAMFLATALLFAWAMVEAFSSRGPAAREIEYAAFWAMQILFIVLSLMWILLIASAIVAWLSGSAVIRSFSGAEQARASAAVRTSRLSLALSASAMLALIVIVWSGLLAWGLSSVNVFECMQVEMFPPLAGADWMIATPESLLRWLGDWPDTRSCPGITVTVHGYFRAVLLMSTTSGLPVALLLVMFSLLLLVWMAVPSVRLESEAPSTCTNEQSERVGLWLSRGLDATRIVTVVWWAAVFVVLVVFAAGDSAARHGWLQYPALAWLFETSRELALPILQTTGSVIAASAAALFFGMAKFGGSGLDVMLDVDNYLRELPRESTPRAHIAERYVSLLRAIASDRSSDGRPYDSVIIVAHSLGALISADLLRYLNSESEAGRGDPALAAFGFGERKATAAIPIRLFTMGNPIRQLLNRFFPHQYVWVRAVPDNALEPVPPLPPEEAWRVNLTPSHVALGVEQWSNAYRSGDYVGRGLWQDEWFRRTESAPDAGAYPEPIKVFSRSGTEEMCIGLGAHTHYWNETAPDVRDHLNGLIASA
ncbi:MAG: hypothetical protein WEA80_04815 [Gemmatimonadaceae bacterium]